MTVDIWEAVLLGVLVAALLLWFGPGMREAAKRAPKGTASDWLGALVPIGLVLLFVALLVAIA